MLKTPEKWVWEAVFHLHSICVRGINWFIRSMSSHWVMDRFWRWSSFRSEISFHPCNFSLLKAIDPQRGKGHLFGRRRLHPSSLTWNPKMMVSKSIQTTWFWNDNQSSRSFLMKQGICNNIRKFSISPIVATWNHPDESEGSSLFEGGWFLSARLNSNL